VDYLYPKGSETIVEPSIPVLKIPIKVGIAFVPEPKDTSTYKRFNSYTLSGAEKLALLKKVAAHFKKYEYIGNIEVIPDSYLMPEGGFSNLEQIQTMYGIDVIALVSYDQVQFRGQGVLSLTYWTLVGAYVINGEMNDTSTLLDTAVYDIKSREMLFRAPGTNITKSTSSLVNSQNALRLDSRKSFELATDQMIKNLDIQLSGFKDKIKQHPETIKVIHREGSSGGGSSGGLVLVCLIFIAGVMRSKSGR
jgi:rhombotail lipoprotein